MPPDSGKFGFYRTSSKINGLPTIVAVMLMITVYGRIYRPTGRSSLGHRMQGSKLLARQHLNRSGLPRGLRMIPPLRGGSGQRLRQASGNYDSSQNDFCRHSLGHSLVPLIEVSL